MGTIHCGKTVSPGSRYDKFLRFLEARGEAGATTREIQQGAPVCNVSATASELRAMGYPVSPAVLERVSEEGTKVYRYWFGQKGVQRDLFEQKRGA